VATVVATGAARRAGLTASMVLKIEVLPHASMRAKIWTKIRTVLKVNGEREFKVQNAKVARHRTRPPTSSIARTATRYRGYLIINHRPDANRLVPRMRRP